MSGATGSRLEIRVIGFLFTSLLLLHLVLVLTNLSAGMLVGLEFRQTQTAISSYFIQAENNFSLAYPTPVLGKPWSVPMEFPLYQWGVVWLSNATGWSLVISARVISALSFYGALPAIFLLLGRFRMPSSRRLLVLGAVLSSPLYIFYSRAFLVEALALAFSVWFLAAFVETMHRRSGLWLIATMVAGAGGALVKITTFIVWCLPAVLYGIHLLRSDIRASAYRRTLATVAWGLACAGPALAVAWWWVRVSDGIKQLNPAGADLVSSRLSAYNFGHWSDRLSIDVWGQLFRQWSNGVLPLWLAGVVLLLAGVFLRSNRRLPLLALGLFLSAQLIFPRLYSIHDYYFYAAGIGVLVAAGSVLAGLLDSKLPRLLVWVAWLVLLIGNLNQYRTGYYQLQKEPAVGGTGLTDAIRNTSPRESVLIIMGDDWSSIIPYYAQRRALMIRHDLEHNGPYIERAFDDLRGEDIFALVVMGASRADQAFIQRAISRFKLDPQITFTFDGKVDVYVRRFHRNHVLRNMGSNEHPFYNRVWLAGVPDAPEGAAAEDGIERFVNLRERQALFSEMNPAPVRYNFAYGPNRFELEGRFVIGAHPVSMLWFKPPIQSRGIYCEFGLVPGAYAEVNGHTDGAEFIISERSPDGSEKTIYRRSLDPFTNNQDRGMQTLDLPWQFAPGAEIVFSTKSGPGSAFDWCYWGRIRIE